MFVKVMGLFGREIRFIKYEVKDFVIIETCFLNLGRDDLYCWKVVFFD